MKSTWDHNVGCSIQMGLSLKNNFSFFGIHCPRLDALLCSIVISFGTHHEEFNNTPVLLSLPVTLCLFVIRTGHRGARAIKPVQEPRVVQLNFSSI